MRTASVVRTLRRGVAVYLYMLIGCVGVSVGSAVEIEDLGDDEDEVEGFWGNLQNFPTFL